jgi:hypothetical protein
MSIGPLGGILGSIAGSQSAQSGADASRVRQDAANHTRQTKLDAHAENTAGIAETDGDQHETSERDADGRRPWEIISRPTHRPSDETAAESQPKLSRDATGISGSQLDLNG